MEWVEISPGEVVIAEGRRAWIHRPAPGGLGDPFSEPMAGPGSLQSTGLLLDVAMAAGKRSAGGTVQGHPLTPVRWAWRLAWQYHTTHATPIVLAMARDRFAAAGRKALADCCVRQIDEETGHDQLALADLRALGYDADALVRAVQPPTARALVDYFYDCARGVDPVRVFGYAYVLERGAMAVGRAYIDAVKAILPPGIHATRCLRVHSAIGHDSHHVAESVEFISGLPPGERARIAVACFETARIQHTPRDGDDPPESEILGTLKAFKAR